MVIAYAEIGYNEDYLHSDLIGGIKVDKVTECSLPRSIFVFLITKCPFKMASQI